MRMLVHARVWARVCPLGLSLLFLSSVARVAAPQSPERLHLAPHYYAGQTLHYQIDFRTQSSSHTSGFISNPQGASQIDLSATLLLRLDILSTLPASAGATAIAPAPTTQNKIRRARMRATYEKSTVAVRGDSYDPAVADLEKQYRKLEGRAVEFTVEADGAIDEVTGLDELLDDPRAAAAIRGWFTQLASGTEFPSEGLALGHTWSKERQMPESPLADTILRSSSTYMRNGNCRENTVAEAAAAAGPVPALPSPAAAEQCAEIVTRFQMKQEGNSKHGQTPDALRTRGLRSSGSWTSSGESLTYLSLTTGLSVSVTQTGADEMNMTIAATLGVEPVHYTAQTHSETHVTLLPEAPAAH